jgi:hypothetical protein
VSSFPSFIYRFRRVTFVVRVPVFLRDPHALVEEKANSSATDTLMPIPVKPVSFFTRIQINNTSRPSIPIVQLVGKSSVAGPPVFFPVKQSRFPVKQSRVPVKQVGSTCTRDKFIPSAIFQYKRCWRILVG